MNPHEALSGYQYNIAWQAQQILMQGHPDTATGKGLDDIADVIGLSPRKKKETDSEIRDRIYLRLGWNDR